MDTIRKNNYFEIKMFSEKHYNELIDILNKNGWTVASSSSTNNEQRDTLLKIGPFEISKSSEKKPRFTASFLYQKSDDIILSFKTGSYGINDENWNRESDYDFLKRVRGLRDGKRHGLDIKFSCCAGFLQLKEYKIYKKGMLQYSKEFITGEEFDSTKYEIESIENYDLDKLEFSIICTARDIDFYYNQDLGPDVNADDKYEVKGVFEIGDFRELELEFESDTLWGGYFQYKENYNSFIPL